jgi:hypothetical protein
MDLAPFLLFVVLLTLFLNDYVENKLVLIAFTCILLGVPLLYKVLQREGIIHPKLAGLIKFRGSYPIYDFSGRKYSASAIALSTTPASDDRTSRFDNELNYERLSRFSEALNSFGAPVAYVSFSCPNRSIVGGSVSSSTNRSFIIVWASGKDDEELQKSSEMYSKQLEGICSVALPNAQTKRMRKEEISLLLSSPLPFALPNLITLSERLKPTPALPAPPPPTSPDPSVAFDPPETGAVSGDGPFLGWVYSGDKKIAPLALYLRDLQRHTSIFGATGGGKSTTAITLALRLFSTGISTLILDWHGEHSRIITEAGGKVFCPGSTEHGITINPLTGCSGRDIGFQVEFVTDIFSQIFQFTAPQSYMFREAIKACYRSKVTPTLSDLINELGLLPIRSSWDHETRMALMRRLKLFTEGTCGMAVNGTDSFYREELFRGLVSIDLSHLKDVNSRSIFSNLLLKAVYDYVIARKEQPSLSHALLIEEAQNILPPRRPEMPRSIGERILGELRKFGEGVIIVSQFPSSISQDVLKNTTVRIIHAIRSGEDLKVLGGSTSLSEEQCRAITSLSPGEAVVNLPYKTSNVFVKVTPDPLFAMPRSTVSDPLSSLPSQV